MNIALQVVLPLHRTLRNASLKKPAIQRFTKKHRALLRGFACETLWRVPMPRLSYRLQWIVGAVYFRHRVIWQALPSQLSFGFLECQRSGLLEFIDWNSLVLSSDIDRLHSVQPSIEESLRSVVFLLSGMQLFAQPLLVKHFQKLSVAALPTR